MLAKLRSMCVIDPSLDAVRLSVRMRVHNRNVSPPVQIIYTTALAYVARNSTGITCDVVRLGSVVSLERRHHASVEMF